MELCVLEVNDVSWLNHQSEIQCIRCIQSSHQTKPQNVNVQTIKNIHNVTQEHFKTEKRMHVSKNVHTTKSVHNAAQEHFIL